MFNKLKGALCNVVGGFETIPVTPDRENDLLNTDRPSLPVKYPYKRPDFLHLNTQDEILLTGDHQIRPIIVPRDNTDIPWNVGYAE